MVKKFVCFAMSASVMLTISCKKEDASSKIDSNATEIAPASPEAVLDPEPNISATPARVEPARPTPPADGKFAAMTFTKKEHDFGKITEGDKVTYVFSFENTGEADLIISDAKGSCGCTVPEYPKEPIAPGKQGKIKVSFSSAGKKGLQYKTVTLMANTAAGKETLGIKAAIQPKA